MRVTGIRGFDAGDRAELRDVFRRAGAGEPALPFGDHDEEIWLIPYMDGQPESLLVATVDDRLVGYLTGCLDSAAMPSEEQRITRLVIEHRLMFRREFVRFSARSMLDMLRAGRGRTASELKDPRWPAHLHVRLVPEARGLGLGTALTGRWLDTLRDTGSAGCHLQTLLENSAAIAFFERLGFTTHGEALLVPGLRGTRGDRLHQQTMVWSP